MGWWELKPKEELDAYQCLQLGTKDNLGREYCEIEDIVKFDVEDGYEISEVDNEYVMGLIKQGYHSGQIDDWDWLVEQEQVIVG